MTLQARTDIGCELHEFNSETDHAHLLVHYPPKIALPRLVNSPKASDVCHFRQECHAHLSKHLWGGRLWSPSLLRRLLRRRTLAIIAEYIESQKRPD
ncbi:transposase [Actinoallomurus sp. CA-150999]|uniref:transposase n=1 Tax=Actinoallomurus sp. CA-150999 TaxID=3239887 RepID=UPI003D90CB8F